ncbi:MAG: prenyltransferase/squalene oxidase repeat-containing protein [Phycisphaerales bacterium]
MSNAVLRRAAVYALVLCCTATAHAQRAEESLARIADDDLAAAVSSGVGFLLTHQEGEPKGEWPYEGVYRVGGKIPIGYRVGNTGICVMAILAAPGQGEDPERAAAITRALQFICAGTQHPLMSEKDYDAGYDVRAWGYIFGMQGMLRAKAAGAVPAELTGPVNDAIAWYCDALQKTEIPEAGGWNYARPSGRAKKAAPSSFMTSCALQALFEAKADGRSIDPAVVDRALAFLEKSKGASGAVQYSGEAGAGRNDQTPGAVGRMLAVETTLMLAGKGSVQSTRGAVDAFIVHWEWLNKRKAKSGTHEGPYAIAPYYFMFAHRYAAMAVELLPSAERAEYRRRINNLLFSVRAEDGTWNDRVFPRTANYGTAFAMLSILEPKAKPTAWKP